MSRKLRKPVSRATRLLLLQIATGALKPISKATDIRFGTLAMTGESGCGCEPKPRHNKGQFKPSLRRRYVSFIVKDNVSATVAIRWGLLFTVSG